jgi:hypothetical protein
MSNRPNLAQLLIESAKKAEQERDLNNQVARIAAIETPKIIAAEKAETSKPMSCPHYGGQVAPSPPLALSARAEKTQRLKGYVGQRNEP